jgi:hypothetical protein
MSSSMLIHDTRVEGTAPGGVPNVFKVDRSVPLDGALGWVAQYARESGGLDRLLILCHGFRGLVNDPFVGMSTTDLGFGLALCREGLTFKTVARTARLRGLIRHILIYACGPSWHDTVLEARRFGASRSGHGGDLAPGHVVELLRGSRVRASEGGGAVGAGVRNPGLRHG